MRSEPQQFGSKYVLGDMVGRGAMGRVYRARVLDGGPDVAIKLLRDDLVDQDDVVARFLQESQVLRNIHHPNLVTVRELVVDSGHLGIVMDLVEGGDLRGMPLPLEPADASDLISRVSDGLVAVHAANVIHRDIKPENVLLESGLDGTLTPRLTDFGVSKIVGQTFTKVTSLIGTPNYLAPEIAAGLPAGLHSDIYSLGVLFYELLAGHVPFEAESPLAVIRMHADAPPPEPAGIPADCWLLLSAMLEKDPSLRPTAAEASARTRALVASLRPPLQHEREGAHRVADETKGGVREVLENGAAAARPTQLRACGKRPTVPAESFASADPPGSSDPVSSGSGPTQARERARAIHDLGSNSVNGTTELALRTRRRRLMTLSALLFMIMAIAATALLLWRSPHPKTTAVADSPIMHAFPPISYQGGVVVSREWALHADGRLRGELEIVSTGVEPPTGEHVEVLPKSAAASVEHITFDPRPDRVLEKDPVVSYDLARVEPGESATYSYEFQVPRGVRSKRGLERLASDQAAAELAYERVHGGTSRIGLTALTLSFEEATIRVGERLDLRPAGKMSDDSTAPTELLSTLEWTTSDPAIVATEGSTAIGRGVGTATISARLGPAIASATVEVLPEGAALPDSGDGPSGSPSAAAPGGGGQPSASGAPETVAPVTAAPAPAPTVGPTVTQPPATAMPSPPQLQFASMDSNRTGSSPGSVSYNFRIYLQNVGGTGSISEDINFAVELNGSIFFGSSTYGPHYLPSGERPYFDLAGVANAPGVWTFYAFTTPYHQQVQNPYASGAKIINKWTWPAT